MSEKETENEVKSGFDEWCIVELMGHIKMAGRVTERELFGSKLAQIDVPAPDGKKFATQFFGGGSVYRITPTTEEVARAVARNNAPAPIHRWELQLNAAPDDDGDDEPQF